MNRLPTLQDVKQFVALLQNNSLEDALMHMRDVQPDDMWCAVNTTLVAVYAVLHKQTKQFHVLHGVGNFDGTHVVGALGDQHFDYPRVDQYKNIRFKEAPMLRKTFLDTAKDLISHMQNNQIVARLVKAAKLLLAHINQA